MISTKNDIENKISELLNSLCEAANNKVRFTAQEPSGIPYQGAYGNSDKVIYIDGNVSKNPFYQGDSILLFGYSIDPRTGYPVTIQTREQDSTIFDEDALVDFILQRIKTHAVRIMEISESGDNTDIEDIPF